MFAFVVLVALGEIHPPPVMPVVHVSHERPVVQRPPIVQQRSYSVRRAVAACSSGNCRPQAKAVYVQPRGLFRGWRR